MHSQCVYLSILHSLIHRFLHLVSESKWRFSQFPSPYSVFTSSPTTAVDDVFIIWNADAERVCTHKTRQKHIGKNLIENCYEYIVLLYHSRNQSLVGSIVRSSEHTPYTIQNTEYSIQLLLHRAVYTFAVCTHNNIQHDQVFMTILIHFMSSLLRTSGQRDDKRKKFATTKNYLNPNCVWRRWRRRRRQQRQDDDHDHRQ